MNVCRFKRRRSLKTVLLCTIGVGLWVMYSNAIADIDTQPAVHRRREDKAISYTRDSEKNSESLEAVFKDGDLGNYEPRLEPVVVGPGEGGQPHHAKHRKKHPVSYGCNMDVSDEIALNRTIIDSRNPECRYWHYPSNLPSTSVVIIFYNEGNSTLLRTVQSVINKSPPHLLKEIVLVDDASTLDYLKQPLEDYIKQFNGKVKIFRNSVRLGLIGARMRGAREATGDVMVVLDSHCECNANWLPPLLQRIALNRKTLAQPTVDIIKYSTFEYINAFTDLYPHGVFDWGLLYKEIYLPVEEGKRRSQPFPQPTHAGGLFAIDRLYFLEIGGYDENIKVWGGENFQLSFKIWMCGGQIEMVPCSRVGHVYHSGMPFSLNVDGIPEIGLSIVSQNYLRVVQGWMDDYAQYFYIRKPNLIGYTMNVTDQLELRKRLGCHSFQWFMDNVAKDMLEKFPLPKPNRAVGRVKLRHIDNFCMKSCSNYGIRYNTAGQLGLGEYCTIYDETTAKITTDKCPDSSMHTWDWNLETGLIRHPKLNQCIQAGSTGYDIILAPCDPDNLRQQWDMENNGQRQTW